MPEAAVHKADCSVAGKDEVGSTRERRIVGLVAEAAGVEPAAQSQLRPRVLALPSRHDVRTSRGVEDVWHASLTPGQRSDVGVMR